MSEENEILLPCPFCGSAWIDQYEEGYAEGEEVVFYYCMDCGAMADSKVWNKRAKRPLRERLVEVLQEVRGEL